MVVLLLFSSVTGFLLSYITIPPIVAISNKKNLFDVPNHRKLNRIAVPTLGGMAIFFGASVSSVIFLQNEAVPVFRYLFAASVIMLFTGLKDDMLMINPREKLIAQSAAALILVLLGNFRIVHIYGIGSVFLLSDWISIPLSILIILFLINAINLIDGIDGLAAGIGLLISTVLGTWFYFAGHAGYAIGCMALSGSLLAFLRFNLWSGRDKIFMGDTGSLMLGVILAAMGIRFNELNAVSAAPFRFSQAPLLGLALFIVPVTDTLRVFTIRIRQKRSPFSPDMNHFHHLLIRLGLTHIQASSFLISYTVFFTLLALTLSHFSLYITLGFILLLSFSFSVAGLISRKSKRVEMRKVLIGRKVHLEPEDTQIKISEVFG